MNLVFNAESLRPPVTGVGVYSYRLLEQFVRSGAAGATHCFTGTDWQDGAAQLAMTATHMTGEGGPRGFAARAVQHARTAIGLVPGTKPLYDHVMDRRFQRYAERVPEAVYHETNYLLKPFRGPCVTTVHDLSHLRFPTFHKDFMVARFNRHLPRSLARADAVITVSNLVREELVDQFPVVADKVFTIYEGVDGAYRPRPAAEVAAALAALGLAYQRYVLLVATLEPRKGVDVLLDAWEALPAALRREYPLVMTGSSGWRNSALVTRLERLLARGDARHLGYVPAELLPTLYSGAAVFCYPSVYEGFGLPVLDAMSSGVPVICRAGTSMAEFADGNCVLCETGEPAELADKLSLLLSDEDLRGQWGARGRERSRAFSWERCARATLEVYQRIARR